VLAVVGVGGYLFYDFREPQLRTVEYHRQALLKEPGPIYKYVAERVPSAIGQALLEKPIRRARFHWDALVKLGYLEERIFVLSNRSPYAVDESRLLRLELLRTPPNHDDRLTSFTDIGTNTITIVAPRDQIPLWEKLIREADVPEK
jgi:hypothetical protein